MVEGLQETNSQKGDRRIPAKPSPMKKLVSQRREFQVFVIDVSEKFLPLSGSDWSFI